MASLSSKQALAGASVPRNGPFTSGRVASRSLVVRAQQGAGEAAQSRLIGAIAAAQIVLLPLSGAAVADVLPDQLSLGAVGANPAQQFAQKSKAVGNKAKAAVVPDPLDTLASKTKAATQEVKGLAAKGGVSADPLKDLQKKAESAAKQVPNPSADYAKKQLNKGGKAVQQAKPAVKKAVKKAKAANPARDFALKAEQAKNKAKGALPLAAIGFNTSDLQKEVLFGFGEGKSKVEKAVEKNTPSSFSIFDADSVNDARNKLKENIQSASDTKEDPSERVVSVGKPGESQEENAERIRRESENGATSFGDARAPTN